MEVGKAKPLEALPANDLGDESFMSAEDLRKYMIQMEMARASKEGTR
jgi:hypothetical protein